MTHAVAIPILTDANFAEATAPGSGLVAIDFSAEWCAPCRMMAPIVDAVAQELAGRIRIYQLDNDSNPATIAKLGVRGLPTILVFRDGTLVDRIVGTIPRPALESRLRKLADIR
jgi:thioredoxin 1